MNHDSNVEHQGNGTDFDLTSPFTEAFEVSHHCIAVIIKSGITLFLLGIEDIKQVLILPDEGHRFTSQAGMMV